MKSQLLAIITYRDLSVLSTSRVPKTLHVYGPDQYIRPEQMNQVDISNYCWTVVPNIDRIDFSEYYRQLPRNREEMKVIEHAELPAVTDYIPHSQIAQVKLELYPPDSQQVATIWVVLVSGKIYCTTCFVVVPGKGIEGDFELLEQPSTGEVKQAEPRIVEVKIQDSNEYGGVGISSLRRCRNVNNIEFYVHPSTGIGYKDLDVFTQVPATYFKIVDHFTPQSPSKENGYNRGLHGDKSEWTRRAEVANELEEKLNAEEDERAYAGNLGQSALVVKAKRTDLYRDGGTAEYKGTDNNTYYVWRPTGAVYRDQKHLVHLPDVIIQDIDDNTQYTWDGRHSLYHIPVQKPELSDEAKCPYSRGEVISYECTHPSHSWGNGLFVIGQVEKENLFLLKLAKDGTVQWKNDVVCWVDNPYIHTTRLFYYFEADTSTGFPTDDPNHDTALIAAHG